MVLPQGVGGQALIWTTRFNESSRVPDPAPPGPAPAPRLVRVHAAAGPAGLRQRHWGVAVSFLLAVVMPFAAVAIYLSLFAVPQYASSAGFTVRQNAGGGAQDLLGGISQLAMGPASIDGDILFEFIESQVMVQRLLERMDLTGHYADRYSQDPVFALIPDATIEQAVRHWQRVVHTGYNQSNGLIEVRVRAFTPEMAQALTAAILEEGQALVNDLNAVARADAIRLAQDDLQAAAERLRTARARLAGFRSETGIVDPARTAGPGGVLANLEEQLAQALVEHDLMTGAVLGLGDQSLRQSARRIAAIRARIAEEQSARARPDDGHGVGDFAGLVTEHEALIAERDLAQQSYGMAHAAMDAARAAAARQSRYLAVYIDPTYPQTAEFPRPLTILPQVALLLVVGWSIIVLAVYAVRDRQ